MNEVLKQEEISAEIKPYLESRGIDAATWSALKSSIFPGAEEKSIVLAFDYCKARDLDIMKKPCHIVPMNVKDAKTGRYSWRDVIMAGIAELRTTASRSRNYAGQDAPVFSDMLEFEFGGTNHTAPDFCTVTVYKIINGERVGFSHTEFFEEAANTKKDGGLNAMWAKRKRGQLAKCAEAGALRKAFPEDLGGMPTAEEMEGAGMRDVTPKMKDLPAVRADFKQPEATPKEEPKPKKTEATGRQKKDRHHRTGEFVSVAEKVSESGKHMFVLTLNIGAKTAELITYSSTIGENLQGLEEGTMIDVTFTVGLKSGQYQLESYELSNKGEGE